MRVTPEIQPLAKCAAVALLVALAGCGDAKKTNEHATAGGQVLEASVSDAMLPVDRVRSQPPLAPKGDEEGQTGKRERGAGKGGNRAEATGETGASAPAEAAPAANDAADTPEPARPDAE
jgi:hypothetical protein